MSRPSDYFLFEIRGDFWTIPTVQQGLLKLASFLLATYASLLPQGTYSVQDLKPDDADLPVNAATSGRYQVRL